jgi:cobalt-zinc-cadmium resistance protein CzcA
LKPKEENPNSFSSKLMEINSWYIPNLGLILKKVLYGALGFVSDGRFCYSWEGNYTHFRRRRFCNSARFRNVPDKNNCQRLLNRTNYSENFPEVEQVVSRIGAAEVPTDPMSMEESDVIS